MALGGNNTLSKLMKLTPGSGTGAGGSKAELMASIVDASKKNPIRSYRQINDAQHFSEVTCKIRLQPHGNGGARAYGPGDTIQAVLTLSHSQEAHSHKLRVQGVKVALQGTSAVKFAERRDLLTKSKTFLDESAYVLGAPWPAHTISLPSGVQSFPFCLSFPPLAPASSVGVQLPSSFKGPHGIICYQVVVFLDTEVQYLKKAEKKIHVQGVLHLDPGSEPQILHEKVSRCGFGFGFSSRTPTPKYKFRTLENGVILGRDVEFELRVEEPNASTSALATTGVVSLLLKTTYHGGKVSRAWKDTYTIVSEVVNEQVNGYWRGVLPLPMAGSEGAASAQATYTGGPIEFRYLLRVKLQAGEHMVFKFEEPVKVGTGIIGVDVAALSLLATPSSNSNPLGGSHMNLASATREPEPTRESTCSSSRRGAGPAARSGSTERRGSLPSYSMLSLHLDSMETLPPEYDESMRLRSEHP